MVTHGSERVKKNNLWQISVMVLKLAFVPMDFKLSELHQIEFS